MNNPFIKICKQVCMPKNRAMPEGLHKCVFIAQALSRVFFL